MRGKLNEKLLLILSVHVHDNKNFRKKTKNGNLEQSHSAKNVKDWTLWDLTFCCNISKKYKGPFGAIKNFSKKCSETKKNKVKDIKIAKGGYLVCFRGSGRRFCFERGFNVYSMFWTCLVQVEQINKKVNLARIKNCPQSQSRALFQKSAV